ncbi:hypothetical protein PV646_07690 [Streptomyces sp. ID05-26A]|nr:hypothetical protein [Streptomyces sp. ID05-26A]
MKAIVSGPLGTAQLVAWSGQVFPAQIANVRDHQHVSFDAGAEHGIVVLQPSLVESWFSQTAVAHEDGAIFAIEGVSDEGDLVCHPFTGSRPRYWRVRKSPGSCDKLSQLRVNHLAFLDEPPAGQSVALPWGPVAEPRLDSIVDAITAELSAAAAEGWQRIHVECEATAGWQSLTTTLSTADGEEHYWLPPASVSQWFHRLRAAGHSFPSGTWFTARYTLEPGQLPTLAFDTETEPAWQPYFEDRADFAVQALRHEATFFPRFPTHVPDWLAAASAMNAVINPEPEEMPRASPELLLVRAVDGMSEQGVAICHRTPVTAGEKQLLLDYLTRAPVVLASRGFAPDAVDPAHPDSVPMVFRTDGRFVWSGSVPHYLEHHDIAPDVAFLGHVRAQQYRTPTQLPSAVRARALAVATGAPDVEPGLTEEFEQAASAVLATAAHLNLDPASYSLGTVVDGALCLVREGDRYVVFWLYDEDRRFYAAFDSPGDAATYLIGFFYSYAGSLQRT